jgi:hypothetical protein
LRAPAATASRRARERPICQRAKQIRSRAGLAVIVIVIIVVTTIVVIGERRFWSELAERHLAARRLRIDQQRDSYPERQQGFWSQP